MSGSSAGRRPSSATATLNDLFAERREAIQLRFDARYRVVDCECWLWTGGIDRYGYGQFYISQYKIGAHRAAYVLKHGPIPENMLVCHTGDERSCVNPEHLFLGTDADNNADRSIKRRSHQPFGCGAHRRKLTVEDVLRIRTEKVSARSLARELGVNPNTVAKIRRGESWKHVAA